MHCDVMIYSAHPASGNLLATSHNNIDNGSPRLPTGRVALGETPIEAASRILQEETGYTAGSIRFKIIYQTYNNGILTLVYNIDSRHLISNVDGLKVKPGTIVDFYTHRALQSGVAARINKELVSNI